MKLQLIEAPPDNVDTEPAPATATKRSDVQTRWGGSPAMLARGFVGVPVVFLEGMAQLKPHSLTPAEALFVICVMAHKWDERPPFPSYKRIASWMGKTESYVRKVAKDLETKGMLRRIARIGRSNAFDLEGLFAKLTPATAPSRQSTRASTVTSPRTKTRKRNAA
ncbi:MAG: hypothetical protein IPK85_21305 [Gemmatimonadetes bacterium]|nr:hypothetical protein [Gemmatimonadota bacterium]